MSEPPNFHVLLHDCCNYCVRCIKMDDEDECNKYEFLIPNKDKYLCDDYKEV